MFDANPFNETDFVLYQTSMFFYAVLFVLLTLDGDKSAINIFSIDSESKFSKSG